jgi:hypothetical protein
MPMKVSTQLSGRKKSRSSSESPWRAAADGQVAALDPTARPARTLVYIAASLGGEPARQPLVEVDRAEAVLQHHDARQDVLGDRGRRNPADLPERGASVERVAAARERDPHASRAGIWSRKKNS